MKMFCSFKRMYRDDDYFQLLKIKSGKVQFTKKVQSAPLAYSIVKFNYEKSNWPKSKF